jgi:CRP-like cAMP-binding protein
MITSEKFILVRKLDFFNEFNDDELQSFLNVCAERTFENGEVIFEEGSIGDEFYIIIRGSVEILKETSSGERQLLAVIEDGSVFGEMSIIDQSPRSATAAVAEDGQAELLVIKKVFLEELSLANIDIATKLVLTLIKYISERLRLTSERAFFAQNTLNNFND